MLCIVENSVIDAIHALEEMEDYEVSDEVMLPKVNYDGSAWDDGCHGGILVGSFQT